MTRTTIQTAYALKLECEAEPINAAVAERWELQLEPAPVAAY